MVSWKDSVLTKGAGQLIVIMFILAICILTGFAWLVSNHYLQPESRACSPDQGLHCGSPGKLGLAYSDVLFETVDGLTIAGWYIPGDRKGPGIVMVSGWEEPRHVGLRYCPMLHDLGFNLLLIDVRNRGESDGMVNSMGYHERKDIDAAVRYLLKRKKLPSVGVMGFSTGAGIGIMAMAENPDIAVGVFESAFSSFEHLLTDELQARYGFSHPLLIAYIVRLFEFRSDSRIGAVSPLHAISTITARPIFIIHGTDDEQIAFKQAVRLFASANEPKRFWPVSGGKHIDAWQVDKGRTKKEMTRFFLDGLMPHKASP